VQSHTELLVGKNAVRNLFVQLSTQSNYLAIVSSAGSVDVLGETFWHNFHAKQQVNETSAKLLFDKSLDSWGVDNPNLKIRYMETSGSHMETLVYGDTVALVVFTSDPSATLIHNSELAKSYRDLFEILWERAEK
jgi:hypothetical protein